MVTVAYRRSLRGRGGEIKRAPAWKVVRRFYSRAYFNKFSPLEEHPAGHFIVFYLSKRAVSWCFLLTWVPLSLKQKSSRGSLSFWLSLKPFVAPKGAVRHLTDRLTWVSIDRCCRSLKERSDLSCHLASFRKYHISLLILFKIKQYNLRMSSREWYGNVMTSMSSRLLILVNISAVMSFVEC